ncbi:MAG: AAA family ATPase [Vicinamibacteria bacterium]|jgi:CO dehydrogenase maturation factor|nr:AAA family ATPase [Vicinamibacteria bacterium]
MKIAVSGKGGVGKTTIAAYLARGLQAAGRRVIAVDADPDANLASALGYRGAAIATLADNKALIEERVGGGAGLMKMNPRVDDLPDRLSVVIDGLRLLVMGTIERGRQGCACAANVLLRELLGHLVLAADEDVVVDLEAGIEHLGRGTAEGVDRMIIVVEPGAASLQSAAHIARLARDLGLARLSVVANKVVDREDEAFVRDGLRDLPLIAVLPFDREVERAARQGAQAAGAFGSAMRRVVDESLSTGAASWRSALQQRGSEGGTV